jgi:hypothetical protein
MLALFRHHHQRLAIIALNLIGGVMLLSHLATPMRIGFRVIRGWDKLEYVSDWPFLV